MAYHSCCLSDKDVPDIRRVLEDYLSDRFLSFVVRDDTYVRLPITCGVPGADPVIYRI